MIRIHILLSFLLTLTDTSELPPWHMKPLGYHIDPDPVDEAFTTENDAISAHDFAHKYILPRKPIVFRNIAKQWPAYTLWTDKYLSDKYGEMEIRLEAKKEKQGSIPKGDVCLGRDTMKKFLEDYVLGVDKYMVSELPTPMWGDVQVPPPMSCGELVKNFVEIDVWMNSDTGKKGAGGNSLLHKDAYNTVNCVLNGTKEWKLIELKYNDYVYQSWEGPMDAGYGGFSLINPSKVDAREFPDVGKIPHWQFVTINAGDCLFLPSQMWHQVKSAGHTNRAVAFLFSQFEGRESINTEGCDTSASSLSLADVDVDLQYPGTGIMTMGHEMIEEARASLQHLVDEESGLITKRSTFIFVYAQHSNGNIVKKIIVGKAKKLYTLLLKKAGGQKKLMTSQLIKNLSRDDIRATYLLISPMEPSNTYDYEYSTISPENIKEVIEYLRNENKGRLEKDLFMRTYEDHLGGTQQFAERLWRSLAGDRVTTIEDIPDDVLESALEIYENHRRYDPENVEDETATLTTPQGHITQPKRRTGVYTDNEKEHTEPEVASNNNKGAEAANTQTTGVNKETVDERSNEDVKDEL